MTKTAPLGNHDYGGILVDSAFAYLKNKNHRKSVITIVILLLGLVLGLFLIRNPQIFNPRAAVQYVDVELGPNVKMIGNEKVVIPPVNHPQGATIPIKIKLTTPFDGVSTLPSEPTVNINCASKTGSVSWTGTPGKASAADPGNFGKDGFYVDISTTQGFSLVYNKFVETSQNSASTTAPDGFVLANATSTNPPTGSPLSLNNDTTYYVRIFNGGYSSTKTFNCPSGGNPTPSPSSSSSSAPTPTPVAGAPTLNLIGFSCVTGSPEASISWSGNPGQGASGDTANVGKSGFYVDVSPNQSFDLVYNKFVETNQSTGSTTAPGGFVLANAGRSDTGSPLSLTDGSRYYVRVYNGNHSNLQEFVVACGTAGGNTSQAEAVVSNWGKTVPQGTLGDISNNGFVDSLDFERAFKDNAVQSFLNNLIPVANAADSDTFATCNGTKTIGDAKKELTLAYYNGPTDDQSIKDAYLRTACPGGQPAGGTTRVLTCKGESVTIDQLNQILIDLGYDIRGKTLTEKQDAYTRAACPLGPLKQPIQTCKYPLGGPTTIEQLMVDLRAPSLNFPDQQFRNTTLPQAIAAYNEAQVECRSTQGFLDDQVNDCQARGWAAKANPNSAPTTVSVKIYRGNKTELLGTVRADKPRADLTANKPWLRASVNHGFEFTLPDRLKGQTTQVYAFAVDPTNASNEVALETNGRNITCSAGASTPTPSANPTPTPSSSASPTPAGSAGFYKLIESDEGKIVYEDTDWKPMPSSPFTIDHGISSNPNVKTLTVLFKSADGRTETRLTTIRVISIAPHIDNLTCSDDANGIVFEAKGKNFDGNSKMVVKETTDKDLEKSGTTTPSLIKGLYKGGDSSKGHRIVVVNPDGRFSNAVECKVNSKAFQLRANVFCQQIWPFDVEDVEMTFVDRGAGGTKVTEKVIIGKDGMVKNIKSRLQSGRNYAVAVKAPKSLRRVINFTATEGTDVLDSLMLPVGDIWGPGGRPDGVINANDRGRFNEDWRVLTDSPDIRLSDFNRDKRVNSFDWACMRQGFNESDDQIPGAGATAEYKFDPAAPNAGQKVKLTVDKVSLAATTYDYIALRVKPKGSQPEKYLWFNKQTASTQGPPFFWESDDERNTKLLGAEAKFYDLSTNGEYSFQMVAHCKYPENEDTAFPDCSQADIFFNEVTLTIGQIAAPSAPTVQVSCTNNTPAAAFSWTGTAGKGADADTANKGKTGFYVDISPSQNFDPTYNKFVETTSSNGTTNAPTGFVYANAGRPETGSPLTLTVGTKYYARVFNGKHSSTAEFTPTCTTASPSPSTSPAASISPNPSPTPIN